MCIKYFVSVYISPLIHNEHVIMLSSFVIDEDTEKTTAMTEALNNRLCALFDNYKLCQNEGTCTIGSGESFWEVCKCATGYSGLFCETQGSVSPKGIFFCFLQKVILLFFLILLNLLYIINTPEYQYSKT